MKNIIKIVNKNVKVLSKLKSIFKSNNFDICSKIYIEKPNVNAKFKDENLFKVNFSSSTLILVIIKKLRISKENIL
jgi:hypothetical protein